MDTGIATDARQAIGERLHEVLSDLYATFVMTQNLHWNLTGKEFYQLHILLEKQYEDLHAVIDEVAERIRALGLYVDASLASFQKQTTVKECKQLTNANESLKHLLQTLEGVVKRARAVGNLADEKRDHASVDLIGRLMGQLEKSAWMVRSSL
jgi:starvation-inducible DNA-binding protein